MNMDGNNNEIAKNGVGQATIKTQLLQIETAKDENILDSGSKMNEFFNKENCTKIECSYNRMDIQTNCLVISI